MRTTTLLIGLGALIAAPAMTLAQPGHGRGAGQGPAAGAPLGQPAGHSSQGPTNGKGWDHFNSPSHQTGQPDQSCETGGSPPGGSTSAPGSAFNPDGNAGTRYAGEQPQNSRNSASVSQYDVACANQPG